MTSFITTIACLFFSWVRIGPPNQLDLDRGIQCHNHIQEPRLLCLFFPCSLSENNKSSHVFQAPFVIFFSLFLLRQWRTCIPSAFNSYWKVFFHSCQNRIKNTTTSATKTNTRNLNNAGYRAIVNTFTTHKRARKRKHTRQRPIAHCIGAIDRGACMPPRVLWSLHFFLSYVSTVLLTFKNIFILLSDMKKAA